MSFIRSWPADAIPAHIQENCTWTGEKGNCGAELSKHWQGCWSLMWQIGIGFEPKHLKRSVCKRQGQPLYFFRLKKRILPVPSWVLSPLLRSAGERKQNPGTALKCLMGQNRGDAASSQTKEGKQGMSKIRNCVRNVSAFSTCSSVEFGLFSRNCLCADGHWQRLLIA